MLKIPYQLAEQLGDDSFIPYWLGQIERYLSESPHYFPEYTKHGVNHVNEVLRYTDLLIPVGQRLSPKTTECLVAGIILHDIGMQIMPDGLRQMLLERKWCSRWDEYYRKVSDYSDSEHVSRFGHRVYIHSEFPDKNMIPENETFTQKLIIGDFLREWHGELAYDIAVGGFYGADRRDVFVPILDNERRELIGRIAQSHMMPLRNMEPLLKNSRYGGQNADKPLGVPIYYAMALLRIADSLDASEQRAPRPRQWMHHLRSPVSNEHFTLNQVVSGVLFPPDTLYDSVRIDAFPKDSKTFVALREWIGDIQRELDFSWAVLSEKYGAQHNLTVHRVHSNITDPQSIQYFNHDFLTEKAYLKASPNILKYLIAPLYGDEPSYGVRELVANAVDACSERALIESERGNVYHPNIRIDITDISNSEEIEERIQKLQFTITDNGIGMTSNIILNYYLTSGVSFRETEQWKKLYASGDRVKVVRNGKFGIGSLSAFLLGDTITVKTRNIDEDRGYEFSLSLDAELINVKCIDCDIGTRIEIPITNELYAQVMSYISRYRNMRLVDRTYDYFKSFNERFTHNTGLGCYYFSRPKISNYYNNTEVRIPVNHVPSQREMQKGKFANWYRFEDDNLFVAWQHPSFTRKDARYFCNGFPYKSIQNRIDREYGCAMTIPIFSAEDPLGMFDCDLARSSIKLPDIFVKELFRYKVYLLFMLDIEKTFRAKRMQPTLFNNTYKLLISESGFTLSNDLFIKHTGIDEYYYLYASTERELACQRIYSDQTEIPEKEFTNLRFFTAQTDIPNEVVYLVNGFEQMNWTKIDYIDYSDAYPFAKREIVISVLNELIPPDRNGGWIPFNFDERRQMYPETFEHFIKMRYMTK